MAITIRGVATQTAWSAATRSPVGNYPAGVAQGDLLLAFFTTSSAHNGAATVGIWTKIQEVDDTGADSTSSLYWTIAPASPGTSFTFTNVFAATETGMVVIVAYQSNCWGSGAIHKSSGIERTVAAAGLATSTATVQTRDNCLIIQFIGCDPGTGAYTATPDASPTGVELFDVKESTGGSLAYSYVQSYQQTTAASLALDATMARADEYQVIQVAIIGGLDAPIATAAASAMVPTVAEVPLPIVNAVIATASAAVKISTGTVAFNIGADKATSSGSIPVHTAEEVGGGGATVTQIEPISASGAVLVPTLTAGVVLSPPIITAAASVKVPTATGGSLLQAVLAAASGLAQAAVLIVSASIAPPAPASASGTVRVPAVQAGAALSGSIAPAASTVLVPGIGAATNIGAVIATAQGTALVPTMAAGQAAPRANASGIIPIPGVASAVTTGATTAQASGLIPLPSFGTGLATPRATAQATALVPAATGAGLIAPPVAAASGVVLVPAVKYGAGLAPTPALASAAVQSASMGGTADVNSTPAMASATVLAPSFSNVVLPSVAAASGAIPASAVIVAQNISAVSAVASAQIPQPAVGTYANAQVNALAAASAAILQPALTIDANLSASVASAAGIVPVHKIVTVAWNPPAARPGQALFGTRLLHSMTRTGIGESRTRTRRD